MKRTVRLGSLGYVAAAWLVGALLVSGCGKPIYVIDIKDNLAKLKNPAPGVSTRASTPLRAQVVGTPTMAVVTDVRGRRVVPLDTRAGMDEVAAARAWVDANPSSVGAFVVKGYGTAVAERCRFHLARYFENPSVELTLTPTADCMQIMPSGYLLMPGFYSRQVAVQLTATPPGAPPIVVDATSKKASSAGHLAWALPVILIHGLVVGFIVVSPIFSSINKGLEEAKTLEAIDMACADLASRLGMGQPAAVR
jgi:hypothetical protein